MKIQKFVNFGAMNSGRSVRSMKKEYGYFSFSYDIILKQNCIDIFLSLSLVNTFQNYIGLY